MKRLALTLLGIGVALALGEIGLRPLLPSLWKGRVTFEEYEWLTYDPILGWANQPDYSQPAFHINALGQRGAGTQRDKPAGTLRIICIGDSRTFGVWLGRGRLRFDNDYPSTLAALLANSGMRKRVEVINAGVIGYTSAHGLRQFITRLVQLQPDIVTVAFGFNDHLLSWKPALRCTEPHDAIRRGLLYTLAGLRTFQLGLSVYQTIGPLHPPLLSVPWVEPDEYAYNLHRFAAVARDKGIRLLLLAQALRPLALGDSTSAFPGAEKPRDPYALMGAKDLADLHRQDDLYRERLYQVAREDNVAVADAAAVFGVRQGEALFGPYDLVHTNVAGARVVAQTIYAKLAELGWLSQDN